MKNLKEFIKEQLLIENFGHLNILDQKILKSYDFKSLLDKNQIGAGSKTDIKTFKNISSLVSFVKNEKDLMAVIVYVGNTQTLLIALEKTFYGSEIKYVNTHDVISGVKNSSSKINLIDKEIKELDITEYKTILIYKDIERIKKQKERATAKANAIAFLDAKKTKEVFKQNLNDKLKQFKMNKNIVDVGDISKVTSALNKAFPQFIRVGNYDYEFSQEYNFGSAISKFIKKQPIDKYSRPYISYKMTYDSSDKFIKGATELEKNLKELGLDDDEIRSEILKNFGEKIGSIEVLFELSKDMTFVPVEVNTHMY